MGCDGVIRKPGKALLPVWANNDKWFHGGCCTDDPLQEAISWTSPNEGPQSNSSVVDRGDYSVVHAFDVVAKATRHHYKTSGQVLDLTWHTSTLADQHLERRASQSLPIEGRM